MKEIWKAIPGYQGYEASSLGRIRSHKRKNKPPLILKGHDMRGYIRVEICKGDVSHNMVAHRLVAFAFLGEPKEGQTQVAHNDGNRSNNVVSNLRWATPKENYADKIIHGRKPVGSKHGSAKLTEKDVLEIRSLYLRKSYGEGNTLALAKQFGVTQTTIHNIVSRRYWIHI